MRYSVAKVGSIRPGRLAAAIGSVALFAATCCLAAEPDRLAACFAEWPPYAYTGDGGPAGLSVQVIGEAARRAGLRASFTPLPWKRCLRAVEQGEIDVALDGLPRDSLINGTTPHPVLVSAALVRGDLAKRVTGAADLSGLVLGHPIGWAVSPPLQAMIDAGSISVARPVTRDQVVAMMKAGRVDFALDAYGEFQRLAREAGIEVEPVAGTVTVTQMYPLVSPGRPELRDRLDAALARMVSDGTMDRLFVETLGMSRSELLAAGHGATD